MSNTNQFDWVPFYRKVADRLLDFQDDRTKLVSKVKQIFKRAKLKLPTLERDNAIVDMDPFTFFGLFNKTSMKPANRLKIIQAVAETLPVSAPVLTSFDSVPVLNPLNATFYYFTGERGEQDIDELWVLFASALHYADNPTEEHKAEVSRLFDLAIGKKGNGNSKITMALYWIAPDAFLNLDSRNEWYIYQSGKIPASVVQSLPAVETKISAEMYFEIAEKLKAYLESGSSKLKNFRELSYEAWVLSQKVNDEEKAQKAQAEKKPKGAAVADDNVETVHYWMFSPGDGAASWEEFYDAGIMAIGWDEIGDLSVFPSKDAMKRRMKECYDASKSYKNSTHATWQFVHDLKPGDIVFAKKGMHLIVGKGVVEAEYEFDAARSHYKNVRKVNWTHKGEWASPSQGPMKTLTDVTPYTEYVEKVKALFADMEEEEDIEEQERTYPAYGREKFLSQVYMDETSYDTLVGLLNYKKNVILQGPPGGGENLRRQAAGLFHDGGQRPEPRDDGAVPPELLL